MLVCAGCRDNPYAMCVFFCLWWRSRVRAEFARFDLAAFSSPPLRVCVFSDDRVAAPARPRGMGPGQALRAIFVLCFAFSVKTILLPAVTINAVRFARLALSRSKSGDALTPGRVLGLARVQRDKILSDAASLPRRFLSAPPLSESSTTR